MAKADESAEHVRALFISAPFGNVEVLHPSYDPASFGNAVALVRADGLLFRLVRERGEEFVEVTGPAFYPSDDVEEGLGWKATAAEVVTAPEPVAAVLGRLSIHRADLVQALQPERVPFTISQLERAREARRSRMVARLEGRKLRSDQP